MAVPCVVKKVGAKMKNRTPYDKSCKYEPPSPGRDLFMRFGAVWEDQRRCACNVQKHNDLGQLHAMDIVA